MKAFFSELGNLGIIVFSITSMLSVGLAYTWRELAEPLKNRRGVAKALIANFVLVPVLAWVVLRVFDFGPSFSYGLFLVASAGGAAFAIKVVEVARKDIALATTVLLVLLPATVIYMPLVVPFVLPEAQINAWAIGAPLLWMLFLPLGAGLIFANFWPKPGARLQPIMQQTSSIALVILVLSLLIANIGGIIQIFGEGVFIAAFLILGGAYLAGYVLGGTGRDTRAVLGFSTAQRNYGAALVVASQSFADPLAVVTIVITSIVSMALLFPLAWYVRSRPAKKPPTIRRRSPISIYGLPEEEPIT